MFFAPRHALDFSHRRFVLDARTCARGPPLMALAASRAGASRRYSPLAHPVWSGSKGPIAPPINEGRDRSRHRGLWGPTRRGARLGHTAALCAQAGAARRGRAKPARLRGGVEAPARQGGGCHGAPRHDRDRAQRPARRLCPVPHGGPRSRGRNRRVARARRRPPHCMACGAGRPNPPPTRPPSSRACTRHASASRWRPPQGSGGPRPLRDAQRSWTAARVSPSGAASTRRSTWTGGAGGADGGPPGEERVGAGRRFELRRAARGKPRRRREATGRGSPSRLRSKSVDGGLVCLVDPAVGDCAAHGPPPQVPPQTAQRGRAFARADRGGAMGDSEAV